MEFSNQIKKLRATHTLTQEQLGKKLNVSRQTISSWETGRNLPDLEMVVTLAKLFGLSLDTLILGDDTMENKLIKDSDLVRRSKYNMISITLVVIGLMCLLLKSFTETTVLESGVLHEPYFFLLPIGFLLLFSGIILGLLRLIFFGIKKLKNNKKTTD
ncbi:helix-turn-helix domain-containing protein [Vagococcus sp. PNs007]|uniref:Helix-turn-helix domain-containing protein n=1 Tax=Vagococcus proximus TaxID=2991417 RepID=A0ABT5X441_9ENTE|nr:helix-turn-helix domain-containing protein [Vagococcus proximus]MDF0480694.1 helix-turn-helix domain-containing protein [Vagococcus proximus]